MFQLQKSFRKAAAVAVIGSALALGLGGPARADVPKGPFNCAIGPTALPDDRWSSCAVESADYCVVGPTAVPDDRWQRCVAK